MISSTDDAVTGRDLRQREIVPPERLADCHVLVIGVGAIGRQVASQLAAVGAPRLTLFDDDTVQVENLAPQGYWPEHLNLSKALVTAELCRRINPEIEILPLVDRFKRSSVRILPAEHRLVAFLCVDSIGTRRLIWESLRPQAALLVDGRMSAEVVRVLAVAEPGSDLHYESTLFAPEEAYVGSCTARSTIYTASIAAGLMISQFTRWLRGLPIDPDLTLNLLASEMALTELHPCIPAR